MTATINGVMVTGTPKEIAELISLTKTVTLGQHPNTVWDSSSTGTKTLVGKPIPLTAL